MANASQQHWLIGVGRRVGLSSTEGTRLPFDTPPAQAWQAAAKGFSVGEDELAGHVAAAFHMKTANLDAAEPSAFRLLPEADAQRLLVLPLKATDRTLVLATSDPLDVDAEKEIAFISGRNAQFEIAPPIPLRHAINHAYHAGASEDFVVTNEALEEATRLVHFVDEPERAHRQDAQGRAWAMIELTDLILLEAVRAQAEVVAIGPMETGGRVRFQIDGEFQTFLRVPRSTVTRVVDRLKVLADIEALTGVATVGPQSGEIHVRIQDLDYRVRVSSAEADDMILWLTEPGAPALAAEALTPSDGTTGDFPVGADGRPSPLALVVDDDPGDLVLMRTIMERSGFAAVEATNGEQALRQLEGREDYAMLLLDLKMPGLDGLGVLKHVRSTRKTAALPVVILTGSQDAQDEHRLLAAGADDYITKPIDPSWAAQRIQSVLRRSEA